MIPVWLSLPITALRQPDLPRGLFSAWRHTRPLPSSLLSPEEPRAGDLSQLDRHFSEEPQADSVLHGPAGAGPLRSGRLVSSTSLRASEPSDTMKIDPDRKST